MQREMDVLSRQAKLLQKRFGKDVVDAARKDAERLRDQELERAVKSLRSGADPEEVLMQFGRNLTNKLVHGPSIELRRAGEEGRHELLDWARRLLGLGHGGDSGS